MILRALAAWLLILVFAFANGALRQIVLIPRWGELPGHVASTLILSLAILVAGWYLVPWVKPGTRGEAWMVGALWVCLTLAFEFLAGHYLFGTPWERLLADYDVLHGRIWPLVLVTTLCTPALVYSAKLP